MNLKFILKNVIKIICKIKQIYLKLNRKTNKEYFQIIIIKFI